MTNDERWAFVVEKRNAILWKENKTTADKNFLALYAFLVVDDQMPAEGSVYFLYSTATRLKKGIFS